MQDRVGSHVPTEKEIEQIVHDIDKAVAKLRPYLVTLTPDERKSITKFRPGGEEVVANVSSLTTKFGVTLPHISVEGMNADLLLARRLQPLSKALESVTHLVDDTMLEAQGECWWAATAFYTALARMEDADASLKSALKSVVDFFALGRRKAKADAPTK